MSTRLSAINLYLAGGVNGSLTPADPEYNSHGFGSQHYLKQLSGVLREFAPEDMALVGAAKVNKHHHVPALAAIGIDVSKVRVLGRDDSPNWSAYRAVILAGGETLPLLDWLAATGFSLEALTNCDVLIGESAGAMVLGTRVLQQSDPFTTVPGFAPDAGTLYVCHLNNDYYWQPGEYQSVLCDSLQSGLACVALNENEIYHQRWFRPLELEQVVAMRAEDARELFAETSAALNGRFFSMSGDPSSA